MYISLLNTSNVLSNNRWENITLTSIQPKKLYDLDERSFGQFYEISIRSTITPILRPLSIQLPFLQLESPKSKENILSISVSLIFHPLI
jgi:hypothetical protein